MNIVWDGMFPGEQEIAKKIILVTTDFLEKHGTRLEGIRPKGTKVQRDSERVSGESPLGDTLRIL